MSVAALSAEAATSHSRTFGASTTTLALTVLALLLAGQFWLIFAKSFNWDEFYHFSMVYQLRSGTLSTPFQTFLMRLLYWVPNVSADLFTQLLAARLVVWSAFLVGLGSIYGLARQFVAREEALWTTLAYLSAGTVFVHSFAIRTDPIAMALLMLALCLLATRRLGWALAILVGALVGFSGLLTVKSMFYAPCFAGIACLRLSEAHSKRTMAILGAIPVAAAVTYAALFLFHRAGSPTPAPRAGDPFFTVALQWLTQGLLLQPLYTALAIVTAPVFVYALAKAPSAWRNAGLGNAQRIALISLCMPLIVILFYRNVFPYFFTFILAPATVAIAPAIAELRKTYGTVVLAAALCAIPIGKFVAEPRDVMSNQRAVVDYVHQQVPQGTTVFDYSGMVADYPRVVDHLISGIGLSNYRQRGVPLVGNAARHGQLPLIIENKRAISLALAGNSGPESLLPADVAALQGNYVRAWGPVWMAGKQLPAGNNEVVIDIPLDGSYVSSTALTIDGKIYRGGEPVELSAGRHTIGGSRLTGSVLWNGIRVPASRPPAPSGLLFTDF